jgi:hypothetical protein
MGSSVIFHSHSTLVQLQLKLSWVVGQNIIESSDLQFPQRSANQFLFLMQATGFLKYFVGFALLLYI